MAVNEIVTEAELRCDFSLWKIYIGDKFIYKF